MSRLGEKKKPKIASCLITLVYKSGISVAQKSVSNERTNGKNKVKK